jgi:hypothetical protein
MVKGLHPPVSLCWYSMLVEESAESDGISTREMSGTALAMEVFSGACMLVMVSMVISTATST